MCRIVTRDLEAGSGATEDFWFRAQKLVLQQGSETQRVVIELSLDRWYSVMVIEYSVLILELPLQRVTPRKPLNHKPLRNSNAASAGGDKCGRSAIGDQLSPGRSMFPTVLSLYAGPTSPLLPGYFVHSQDHVRTVQFPHLDTTLIMLSLLSVLLVLDMIFHVWQENTELSSRFAFQ